MNHGSARAVAAIQNIYYTSKPHIMAKEKQQRTVNVQVTITLPLEHAYTDSELAETLHVKSSYKEIKVLGVAAMDD